MTRERVRASLAETVVRALVAGDILTLQRLVDADVVDHSAPPGQPSGWPGVRERAMMLCAAMPESECTVDVLSASGDTVLARAELVAVRRDAAPQSATPTRLTVVVVLKFDADLLTEMWASADLVLARPTVAAGVPQQLTAPGPRGLYPLA